MLNFEPDGRVRTGWDKTDQVMSVHGVSPSLVCGVSPLPLKSHSVVAVADVPKLGVAKMSDGHREVAPAVPVQFPSAETLDFAKQHWILQNIQFASNLVHVMDSIRNETFATLSVVTTRKWTTYKLTHRSDVDRVLTVESFRTNAAFWRTEASTALVAAAADEGMRHGRLVPVADELQIVNHAGVHVL